MQSNPEDLQKVILLGGFVFANFGAILASYVSIKSMLARLDERSKQQAKDIDNIAAIIGTERSKSRRHEYEN